MSNLSYYEMRVEMCKIAKLMWERRLTNAAGGNFAVRVDENRILISPSMMSEHQHCELKPEDFLLIDYDENILEGAGKLSREGKLRQIAAVLIEHTCFGVTHPGSGRGLLLLSARAEYRHDVRVDFVRLCAGGRQRRIARAVRLTQDAEQEVLRSDIAVTE